MKQYKLLKDLPFVNAGEVLKIETNGDLFIYIKNESISLVIKNDKIPQAIEEGWIELVDN